MHKGLLLLNRFPNALLWLEHNHYKLAILSWKELVWLLPDVGYKFMEWFRYRFIAPGRALDSSRMYLAVNSVDLSKRLPLQECWGEEKGLMKRWRFTWPAERSEPGESHFSLEGRASPDWRARGLRGYWSWEGWVTFLGDACLQRIREIIPFEFIFFLCLGKTLTIYQTATFLSR